MGVTVRLMGDLRRFADSETIEVETEGAGCTLGVAMGEVVRRHPALGTQLFDDQDRLRYTTLLILEGRSLTWPQDREEPLEDGSGLLIMRFVAGG